MSCVRLSWLLPVFESWSLSTSGTSMAGNEVDVDAGWNGPALTSMPSLGLLRCAAGGQVQLFEAKFVLVDPAGVASLVEDGDGCSKSTSVVLWWVGSSNVVEQTEPSPRDEKSGWCFVIYAIYGIYKVWGHHWSKVLIHWLEANTVLHVFLPWRNIGEYIVSVEADLGLPADRGVRAFMWVIFILLHIQLLNAHWVSTYLSICPVIYDGCLTSWSTQCWSFRRLYFQLTVWCVT